MLFCLGAGKYESKGAGYQKHYQVFNVQLEKEEWEKVKASMPVIKIPLTKWIDKKDMTDDEKEDSNVWKDIGGYLKRNSYEEAWAIWWNEAKQSDKDKILNCGYFNAEIFKGITGIDVKTTPSLIGKEVKVELDGKKYTAKIIS